jgi:hypothetical protein
MQWRMLREYEQKRNNNGPQKHLLAQGVSPSRIISVGRHALRLDPEGA